MFSSLSYDSIDMLDFQKECTHGIPDDYCYKDYSTGEQSFFQVRHLVVVGRLRIEYN